MARERIVRTVVEKIDPRTHRSELKRHQSMLKQMEQREQQREQAARIKAAKEAMRIAERRQQLQNNIQALLDRGEITAEEAEWMQELETDKVVRWAHVPYIDHMTQLRTQMDNGEWAKVCLYLSDKKDYNPLFANYVRGLFSSNYKFEEYKPHESPYKRWKKKKKNTGEQADTADCTAEDLDTEMPDAEDAEDVETMQAAETTDATEKQGYSYEPWADNLYDACAPHLVATLHNEQAEHKFGIMTIWRMRFTKHGLSMMARSQFIKAKLFEQETGIPVFMLIGIGGTAEQPEQLFVLPFSEVENHFVPKLIAYRYEIDPKQQLHFIPELRKLK